MKGLVISILNNRRKVYVHTFILFVTIVILPGLISCGSGLRDAGKTLTVEVVDPNDTDSDGLPDAEEDDGQILPGYTADGLHPIFSGRLGVPISSISMGAIDPDPTGLNACDDYDGDGIPNDHEITSNIYVADYPHIVTRIAPPITMEIRVDESSEIDNYTQTVTDKDVKETITNSMEDKHYASAQQKTTPYVTKESLSDSGSHADSFGYTNSDSYANKDSMNIGGSISGSFEYATTKAATAVSFNYGTDKERSKSTSRSQNSSIEDSFSSATMSEKTVFQDVDYVDNMDKNGVEFTSDTVESMSTNYRSNKEIHTSEEVGSNAGYVRASLFLKNLTVNMPVKISNLICTLSFRTPSGTFLPVKTFKLRNEDYSEFTQDVYGGEELGPYTVEVKDLNTREVRLALLNGYMPQIHVVSYDMTPVRDSNYNPGVDNLKIVEETAKGRTALIKIIGSNAREMHRVAAFDVEDSATGRISPGISLKKALFLTLRDNIGDGESWTTDKNGDPLSVSESGLKWKAGAADKNNYTFGSNLSGNSWRNFETYVKSYEKNGEIYRIETIKRIGLLSKYNPFSKEDNSGYNPNELLSRDELLKMKFWVIFHNGRYYEGDLNDPVWAGDRYEIVCMDMFDFNEHVTSYVYAPFQSGNRFYLDTRWNTLSEEEGEFARAIYLGKVLPNDVVQLDLNLLESRFLFPQNESAQGFGEPASAGSGSIYYNYNYTFEPVTEVLNGIPDKFTYSASGGINSIFVNIKQTQNANSYRIKFTEMYPPAGQTADTWSVSVSRADIEEKMGNVFINSKTIDIYGAEVGYICGTPETSEGGDVKGYKVEVYANGTLNNVNVFTRGDSQSNIAYVADPDPDSHMPKAFSFSASGTTESIDVHILGSDDTEYYLIRCTGPHNYYDAGSVPSMEIIGNAGYNSISLSKYPALRPSFEEMEVKNFETGVYTLEVYAVNSYNSASAGDCDEVNTPGNCVIASNDKVFAEVGFDHYSEQRKFEPRISKDLFDMLAVDIEVNFNDGSGWLKLQLVDPYEYGAQSDDSSEVIDCYYSSHMEVDTQKFIIRFKAPDGSYGLPNVFFGQRPETKLFLRTIPKQKYRDSFWPVIGINDLTGDPVPRTTYEDEDIYLDFNIINWEDGFDITNFWTSSYMTDASVFEDTAKIGYVTNFSDTSKQCYLSKSTGSTEIYDDFFFSPAEQRVFVVKAMVDMEGTVQTPYRPNPPSFTTTPPFPEYQSVPASYTYDSIAITNMSAANATGYEIYWIEGAVSIDPNKTDWQTFYDWMGSATVNRDNYTINQLDFNQVYTIAVAASNRYGMSSPVVRQVSVPNPPAAIPTFPTGTIQVNENGITVVDITSTNAVAYIAYWKLNSQEGETITTLIWTAVDVIDNALQIPQGDIMTAIDEKGVYNDTVVLRIIPVNADNAYGPYWEVNIEPMYCNVVLSEPISDPDTYTAYGAFGHTLTNRYGQPLTNGVDFSYGYPLNSGTYNIYDTGIDSAFAVGKLIRIIVGGINVTDASGLALTPYARNFGQYGYQSPPANQIYIDPVRGEFVLPKPVYWSRCQEVANSLDSLSQATIDDYNPSYTNTMSELSYPTAKFGTPGIHVSGQRETVIYPMGNTSTYSPSKGTVSLWYKINESSNEVYGPLQINFGISSNPGSITLISQTYNDTQSDRISIEGGGSVSISDSNILTNTYHHIYAVWDFSHSTPSNNYVRLYVDGSLRLSLVPTISVTMGYSPFIRIAPGVMGYNYMNATIDNIKMWDRVVGSSSNYSSWEYNGGAGRECALDYIYGAGNGYIPNLTTQGRVGYYYKPE